MKRPGLFPLLHSATLFLVPAAGVAPLDAQDAMTAPPAQAEKERSAARCRSS